MTSESLNTSLKSDLNTISSIISNISLHLDFLEYIYTQADKAEIEAFESYHIFWHLRNAFWSITILDLYKIYSFSKNDNYSLSSIIKRIVNDYESIHWERHIELIKLRSFETQLKNKSDQILIIKKARDQYIAHLDKRRVKIDLKINDLRELLSFSQELYNEINLALNAATTVWHFTWGERGYQVFRNLNKFQKVKEIANEYLLNDLKTIEVEQVIRILREKSDLK
jgi:hypothetical protein